MINKAVAQYCSVFLLTSILIISGLKSVSANDVITWGINDSPPFHILEGKNQNLGFCDQLVNEMQQLLPQYQHEKPVIPQARLSLLVKRHNNICFPCAIKKPDSDRVLYSELTHIYPPLQLITPSERVSDITRKYGNPVGLSQILANSEFLFGQPRARKFGVELQPILDKYIDAVSHVMSINSTKGSIGVMEMLMLGRLDYTIEYSVVTRHFNLMQNGTLAAIPIKENHNSIIGGAITCTRSDWGEKVISSINEVLPKLYKSAKFKESLQYWFAKDNKMYWNQYEFAIRNQKHNP